MKKTILLTILLVGLVQIPLEAQAPPDRRPVRTNWLADGTALAVGDVVTVLVDEYVMATADMARVDQQQRDSNQSLGLGVNGSGGNVGIRAIDDAGDRRRGENTRREVFTAEMTARVIEVSPAGLLRVEGRKSITIDDHEQALTLRGWVRPTDVTSANTIDSWRLADAEVLYTSNGVLGTPKRGIVARILGFIF